MTQSTLDMIHQSYQEALKRSGNIIQIVENLYDILVSAEVPDEDSKAFDAFIDGLRNCIRSRRMTSDITDIVTYTTITIMQIIKWLNITRGIDIDINLNGRRKSLASDLTKLLRKSTQTLSATIRDRFGLRGILFNENEQLAIDYIYLIHDAIVGILARKNRKMRIEFEEWVKQTTHVNFVTKVVVKEVLAIPFDVNDDSHKDYIKNQKSNGYQSLQFTLAIQPYSHIIPGSSLEIQLRTKNMDDKATYGSASQQEYKKYLQDISELDYNVQDDSELDDDVQESNPILKVFTIDDFSGINIPGLSPSEDIDGVLEPKYYASRRISFTLAPTMSF